MEKEPVPTSFKDSFLIASENLLDPNFLKTVIFMIDHDETGAFGLIMNRPTTLCLSAVLPELSDSWLGDLILHVGGPVQPEYLFLVHTPLPGTPPSLNPRDDLIFQPLSTEFFRRLQQEWHPLPLENRPTVKVMAGYSGWTTGQLETEVEEKAWYWVAKDSQIPFLKGSRKTWSEALKKKGPLYAILAQTDSFPNWN